MARPSRPFHPLLYLSLCYIVVICFVSFFDVYAFTYGWCPSCCDGSMRPTPHRALVSCRMMSSGKTSSFWVGRVTPGASSMRWHWMRLATYSLYTAI